MNKFSFKSAERVLNEKVYVVDTAFATDKDGSLATENLGWWLENVVLVELLRRTKLDFADVFYYKGRESQVDFVVAKDNIILQIHDRRKFFVFFAKPIEIFSIFAPLII